MANYDSSEDGWNTPLDVEWSSTTPFPFPFFSDGLQGDGDSFSTKPVQVDNIGFPIPLTPTTSASSSSYQMADTNQFSHPNRANFSQKFHKISETISSTQDAKEKRDSDISNFYKEYEQEEWRSDFSQTGPHRNSKDCKGWKATIIAATMLFILVTSLAAAAVFLWRINDNDTVVVSPADSAPIATNQPVPSPSIGPTPMTTWWEMRTPSPVASLHETILSFLFENDDVNLEPTDPTILKAFEWLVEEANEAGSLVFPLDSKYLQRFGVLILFYSVNPNVDATISNRVRLPNFLMRNQDECSWQGMTCDENGMVTEIRLQSLGLEGTLPSVWKFFFPNLKYIDISKNSLVGGIPEGLYDIVGLEEIHLYKNQLNGTISSKIGSLWDLRRLHLSHNRISGSIPTELSSTSNRVKKLRSFNVHRNRMTGTIPSNMRLRQLYFLDLGRNSFSGTVPPDFGTESVRLRHLYLDHNNFMGRFPPEIFKFAGDGRLFSLFLNDNQFNGTFPGDHDKSNTMMVELNIENNNFDAMDGSLCQLDVLTPGGKIVEFKSDCNICECRFTFLCRSCWQP